MWKRSTRARGLGVGLGVQAALRMAVAAEEALQAQHVGVRPGGR